MKTSTFRESAIMQLLNRFSSSFFLQRERLFSYSCSILSFSLSSLQFPPPGCLFSSKTFYKSPGVVTCVQAQMFPQKQQSAPAVLLLRNMSKMPFTASADISTQVLDTPAGKLILFTKVTLLSRPSDLSVHIIQLSIHSINPRSQGPQTLGAIH